MMLMSERETAVLRERAMPFSRSHASGDHPCKRGRSLLIACVLAWFAVLPGPVRSEPPRAFVMATDQPETTYEGKWQRLAFKEAFKRLDIPLEVEVMPTQRVSAMVDSADVDGQFMRV